jgi:hypothetical protein
MRKLPTGEPNAPSSPRRVRGELWLAIIIAVLLTPVAYESVSQCVARWQSMTGPTVTVETPILDAIQSTLVRVVSTVQHRFSRAVHNTPWKPSLVIGCGIMLALLASVPLRRVH